MSQNRRNKRRRTDSDEPLSFDERYETATKTNEEVLAMQIEGWSSKVYKHFKEPVIIIGKDGAVKYKFFCKQNPLISCVRSRTDNSTTNLLRHVQTCEGKKAPDDQAISTFAHGSTYSVGEFRYLIALWVSQCHRPFKIVEDPPLQKMFKMLYAKVDIPSDTTVSRDVKEAYAISKKNVIKALKVICKRGRIHIIFDGWTAGNVISTLGLVINYAHEGKVRSFILDFITLTKNHTGEYLAEELEKCFRSFGIEKNTLGQTCDNASNNDTLLSSLETRIPESPSGLHTRIRCIGHILNLVVKAILSQFTKKKASTSTNEAGASAEGDEDDDEDALDEEELAALAEADLAREASDEEEIEGLDISTWLTEKETAVGKSALTKLTKLAKRIFHSPVLREDLSMCCVRAKIETKQIRRSVPTRWNSVADMLNSALDIRPALEKLVDLDRHNQVAKTRLRRFKLTLEEWKILTELRPILQHFLRATTRLSQRRIPLLYQVIPVIDILTEKVEEASENSSLMPVVQTAALKGLAILNKYYSKTDESIMYRITMILNPKYKLTYFRVKKWPQDWIDAALTVLRDHWTTYYKPSGSQTQVVQSARESNELQDDLFAELDNFNSSTIGDELEEYLKMPTIASVQDPLAWWHAIGDTPLARMGRDFMSAPASSCDVERAFSKGGLTISKYRHALTDESAKASVLLDSWSQIPELIPEAEIIKIFKDKFRRDTGVGKQKILSQGSETAEATATASNEGDEGSDKL